MDGTDDDSRGFPLLAHSSTPLQPFLIYCYQNYKIAKYSQNTTILLLAMSGWIK